MTDGRSTAESARVRERGRAAIRRACRLWPVLLIGLGACAGAMTQHVGYAPPAPAATQPCAAPLVVVPFADARPERAPDAPLDPMYVLAVPLVPSVTRSWDRLDESRAAERLFEGVLPLPEHLFEVQLARAVADDLARSDLFPTVELATAAPADGGLVLEGTIVSTRLTTRTTTYFLGLPGMLLWLTGLPNGRTTVDVAIDLALRDRDGTVRWHHPLRADASRVVGLYTMAAGHQLSTGSGGVAIPRYGDNDIGIDPDSLWALHSEALRTGMDAARDSLAAFCRGAV